jgi:hypothetical protein
VLGFVKVAGEVASVLPATVDPANPSVVAVTFRRTF